MPLITYRKSPPFSLHFLAVAKTWLLLECIGTIYVPYTCSWNSTITIIPTLKYTLTIMWDKKSCCIYQQHSHTVSNETGSLRITVNLNWGQRKEVHMPFNRSETSLPDALYFSTPCPHPSFAWLMLKVGIMRYLQVTKCWLFFYFQKVTSNVEDVSQSRKCRWREGKREREEEWSGKENETWWLLLPLCWFLMWAGPSGRPWAVQPLTLEEKSPWLMPSTQCCPFIFLLLLFLSNGVTLLVIGWRWVH